VLLPYRLHFFANFAALKQLYPKIKRVHHPCTRRDLYVKSDVPTPSQTQDIILRKKQVTHRDTELISPFVQQQPKPADDHYRDNIVATTERVTDKEEDQTYRHVVHRSPEQILVENIFAVFGNLQLLVLATVHHVNPNHKTAQNASDRW